MGSSTEVLSVAPTHAIAVRGNVLLQCWEGPCTPDAQLHEFERMLQTLERIKAAATPASPALVLAVIAEHSPVPDARTRALAAKFPQYFDYYVGVHEGEGFRASLLRTVLAGMAMASRVRARYQITSTLPAGCALLASHAAGSISEHELFTEVTALRSKCAAR